MDLAIELSNGDYVLATDWPNSVSLQLLDSNLNPLSTTQASVTNDWIGLSTTASGGFTLSWQDPTTKALEAQDYSASGAAIGSAYSLSSAPAAALQAFTSASSAGYGNTLGRQTETSDGAMVNISTQQNNTQVVVSKTSADGHSMGQTYTATASSGDTFANLAVTSSTETGGYYAGWIDRHQANPGTAEWILNVAKFSASGQPESQETVFDLTGPSSIQNMELVGLPDGGFVVAYNLYYPNPGFSSPMQIDEYAANGQRVSSITGDGWIQSLNVLPDGRYGLTVITPDQNFHPVTSTLVYTEQGAALGTVDTSPSQAQPTGESLVAGTPVSLSASAGWQSAAILSDHVLAVAGAADGGYGSSRAVMQTYDPSGAETGSQTLMGYAGPHGYLPVTISALDGGFYKVLYQGSYEIDNANGQQVFVQNQWTAPGAAFHALSSGGYITTNSNNNVFGLFDTHAQNIGWETLPSWTSSWAYQITGLANGGFVIWGGNHDSFYAANGALLSDAALPGFGDNGYGSAIATASGFDRVWLGQDGAHGTLGTELTFQAFDQTGAAASGPIAFAQDLDPWHTAYQLEANQDGSTTILWSQGGGVFGAEYANGTVGPAFAAYAGDLGSSVVTQLSDNHIGFAYLQNGQLEAELFDPTTGTASRVDLGAVSGDLSRVHVLATSNGGMAISWHLPSGGVEGAILQADGLLSGQTILPGDLLGVNASGEAVTLHYTGPSSPPVMQTFTLNDASFWLH